MNRRDTIKRLMAASGSLIPLPVCHGQPFAWSEEGAPADLAAHHSSFTFESSETLAAVADTIIPPGDDIGALSVGVDKFLQKLIDNCYEKDVQDNVKHQLTTLETSAQQLHGKSFKDCEQQQRQELLLSLSLSGIKEQGDFFELIKSETIRGFRTSREVMVKYLQFKQVPNHYYGCVDVNT